MREEDDRFFDVMERTDTSKEGGSCKGSGSLI